MFFIKLFGELFTLETARCNERRLAGKFVIKPTTVIFLLFAFFYAASPIDLIPEGVINIWFSYIDDAVICVGATCYAIADVTSALEGAKMGKKSDDAADNNQD